MIPGETTVVEQGTPLETGQSSDGKDGSTSQQTPGTFTKEQVRKLVSDALTEQGRKHKAEVEPIVKERDTLKAQIQSKDDDLKDIATERENLQTQLDELASGDPEKFNILKKDKELRERERELKTGKQALEAEKATHGEQVKLATDTLREISIWEITGEYEAGDPVKLKDLCDTLGTTSEEQIRKAADILWTKKQTESETPEIPPVIPYSGKTDGGADDTSKLSPREKIDLGIEKLKKKKP